MKVFRSPEATRLRDHHRSVDASWFDARQITIAEFALHGCHKEGALFQGLRGTERKDGKLAF